MLEKDTRVILADAHPCSRIGLYQVLTDAGFHVSSETGTLNELDTLLQSDNPQILLLSNNLLLSPLIPFLIHIKHSYPQTKIVLLLDKYTDSLLQQLISIGINSIILKTESSPAIIQIIKSAIVGNAAFSQEILSKTILLNGTIHSKEEQNVTLSAQERNLLQLLCADKSNKDIALVLNLSHKTIEKRLTTLYTKLNVKTRTGAAIWYAKHNNKHREIPP